jgi:hypothetical protein
MRQLTARSITALAAGTPESNSENVRSALARGLPEFCPTPCAHDGTFVIVGSGPSMPSFLEEIKGERSLGRPICAIKGAHDFLVENGVEPDIFVSVEPRSRPLTFPNDRTTYMLASRCAPDLFDQLKGKNVLLWHSFASKNGAEPPPTDKPHWNDFNPLDECEVWRGRFGVGGGSTSGLRAFNLAYLMGFRKIVLYGFDSCLAKDKQTKRFTGEQAGPGWVIDVIVGGKRFYCNGALADQATQFQRILQGLSGLRVEAKGDGLIAEILRQRALRV